MKTILRLAYSLLTLTLLLIVTAVMSTTARAQALYTQTFSYAGSASTSSSAFGWSAYIGSTAYDVSVSRATSGGQETVKIFGNNGSPQDSQGYMAFDNFTSTTDTYIGFVSGLNLAGASTLTWQMSVNSASNSVQPMVKVGSTWYVYDTAYTLPATYSNSNLDTNMAAASLCTLDFATATQWKAITITPGTGWTLASTTTTLDLMSSTVTGIGFFATVYGYKSVNFDTIAVSSSVPEPAALASLAMAGLVLGWHRLRRRGAGR